MADEIMKAQKSQNLQVNSANEKPNKATFVFPVRMPAGSTTQKSQCFNSEGRKKLSPKVERLSDKRNSLLLRKVQPFYFCQAAHKIIRVGEQFLNFWFVFQVGLKKILPYFGKADSSSGECPLFPTLPTLVSSIFWNPCQSSYSWILYLWLF